MVEKTIHESTQNKLLPLTNRASLDQARVEEVERTAVFAVQVWLHPAAQQAEAAGAAITGLH